MKVAENEIDFLLVRDTTDSELKLSVISRMTLEAEIGDYILKHFKLFEPDFNSELEKVHQGRRDPHRGDEAARAHEPFLLCRCVCHDRNHARAHGCGVLRLRAGEVSPDEVAEASEGRELVERIGVTCLFENAIGDVHGDVGIPTDSNHPVSFHDYASAETSNDRNRSDKSKKGHFHRRHHRSFIHHRFIHRCRENKALNPTGTSL